MVDASILKTIPIFIELTEPELRDLTRFCTLRTYRKDEVVFLEKDSGEYFYVVLTGKVKIAIQGGEGKEVILSWLTDGDFFGEMALLDEEPRSATVISADSTEMILLRREHFLRILRENPAFMQRIFTVLSTRVRKANHQIESLALLDVYGRVAGVLMDLAMEDGRRLPDGRIRLKLPAHREIANMVGTSRETVSRVLAGLAKHGYLENTGGRSVVINESFPSLHSKR